MKWNEFEYDFVDPNILVVTQCVILQQIKTGIHNPQEMNCEEFMAAFAAIRPFYIQLVHFIIHYRSAMNIL